jgi:ubiquinone/menaquinone biosynthesis C-methylase UbiE
MPHKFNPDRRARLEDPDRLRLLPARDLLRNAGLRAEMSIADIGCGPGVFTLPAAEIVGPAGRVYAVDISPEMLHVVSTKARHGRFTNIETVLAEESAVPLPDGTVDFALVAFVLHEAVQPEAFAREVARLLAPDGRFLLLEWKKEDMPLGPPVADRLTPEEAERWLATAGIRITERFEPNAYHYGLTGLAPTRS